MCMCLKNMKFVLSSKIEREKKEKGERERGRDQHVRLSPRGIEQKLWGVEHYPKGVTYFHWTEKERGKVPERWLKTRRERGEMERDELDQTMTTYRAYMYWLLLEGFKKYIVKERRERKGMRKGEMGEGRKNVVGFVFYMHLAPARTQKCELVLIINKSVNRFLFYKSTRKWMDKRGTKSLINKQNKQKYKECSEATMKLFFWLGQIVDTHEKLSPLSVSLSVSLSFL